MEMIKQLEKQIRDLQRELAEVQKEQAALRLQPCRGDSEIRQKDEKLEELASRARTISETFHGLEIRRHKLLAESILKKSSSEF